MTKFGKWHAVSVLAFISILSFYYAMPIVRSASQNARVLEVFNVDEVLHLKLVKQAVQTNNLNYDFGNYGHLYFNICYLSLIPPRLLHLDISEQLVILTLRLIPTVFFCFILIALFYLARRYFGNVAAWVSVISLWILPSGFAEMSVVSHPDVPQVFFVVMAIYCCCRLGETADWKWLRYASVCSGLAFATKYGGVFLLPVIWFVSAVILAKRPIDVDPSLARRLRTSSAVIGIFFALAAVLLSPNFVAWSMTPDGVIESSKIFNAVGYARIVNGFIAIGLLGFAVNPKVWKRLIEYPRIMQVVWLVGVSVFFFVVGFVVASPFSLYKLNFLHGLLYESQHTNLGHLFSEEGSSVEWLYILFSSRLVSWPVAIFLFGSLITCIFAIRRKGLAGFAAADAIMWIWLVVYSAFLLLRVNMREERYLLPIIPFAFALFGKGVSEFYSWLWQSQRRAVSIAAMLMLTLIGAVLVGSSVSRFDLFWTTMTTRERANASIAAGEWLEQNIDPTARILYDRYSYIPPQFEDILGTWGGDVSLLNKFSPDVVIVNSAIAGRFSNLALGSRYRGGETEYLSHHEYYSGLANGELQYRMVEDFGSIKIFVRCSYQLMGQFEKGAKTYSYLSHSQE